MQELRAGLQAFAARRQAGDRLGRDARRGRQRHGRLRARHRLHRDLAAAHRRARPARRRRRDDLPARRRWTSSASNRSWTSATSTRARPTASCAPSSPEAHREAVDRVVESHLGRCRRGDRRRPPADRRRRPRARRHAAPLARPRRAPPGWSTGSATATRSTPTRGCRGRRRRRAAVRRPWTPRAASRAVLPPAPRRRRARRGARRDRRRPQPRRPARPRGWAATRSAPRCGRRARTTHVRAVLFRVDSPGRLGRRVRHDLARGRADPRGRQAGRRVDGRRSPAPAATTSPALPT